MLEIRFLAGTQAGRVRAIDRYPCLFGRSKQASIVIEDAGVWDKHLELRLDPAVGFTLRTFPETVALLNGLPFKEGRVRNGDVVDIGAGRFQIWLTEARRKNGAAVESLVWAVIALVCAAEMAVIGWLLR